jgi:energy-coupling factor transport system ATP-binding protein
MPPDRGSVRVDGVETRHARRRELAGRVALVFQHPNHQLIAPTVREELALAPRNLGVDTEEAARRAAAAAERFGLADMLDEHPYRLGLPARRRLAIAAVLALQAPVVVLDEPTAGLDEAEREGLVAVVRREAARGAAVIVVTHDLRFAGLVADRVLVLRGGSVSAEGPADRLLTDAGHLAEAGLERPALVRLAAALGLDPAPAVRGPGDALVAAAGRLSRSGDER